MVTDGKNFSDQLKRAMAVVKDCCLYFIDTTTREDISCLVARFSNTSEFIEYELLRIKSLRTRLCNAEMRWKIERVSCPGSEIALASEVFDICQGAIEISNNIEHHLQTENVAGNTNLPDMYENISGVLSQVINKINLIELPLVKPVITEETDAGPGVGVSNMEVKFRFTELCRLHGSDRRVRVHRDRGDSGSNIMKLKEQIAALVMH